MPTIVFIGAGSAQFTERLLGDLLSDPELRDARIVLHDIDPARLSLAERLARRMAEAVGAIGSIVPHFISGHRRGPLRIGGTGEGPGGIGRSLVPGPLSPEDAAARGSLSVPNGWEGGCPYATLTHMERLHAVRYATPMGRA